MTTQELAELLHGAPRRIHLIGVAGSGMSGIAALLLTLGHRVSGSDKVDTVEVKRLQSLGLEFHTPQQSSDVEGAELVVYSSAIRAGNPAYDAAAKLGLPIVRRAEALAALMVGKKGILICGMHGKTTVSAMVAHVLRAGGVHPSHYVGAEIPILGTNARWDAGGEHFVAEGDESDGTIVLYHPEHTVVLNVEPEHLDHYADLAAIDVAFTRLLGQTAGKIVYCADDEGASRLCAARPNAVSYGRTGRYSFRDFRTADFTSEFAFCRDGHELAKVRLNVPGEHNALNATAALAVAAELGLDPQICAAAMETFRGARRRFEVIHSCADYLVVDDYGHHPTEIAAVLRAARDTGRARVVLLFQPHRYTRTRALREEFGRALALADAAVVTDIYPASELPIPGVTGEMIVVAARECGATEIFYEARREQAVMAAARLLRRGDLLVTLGAGNIHEQGTTLARDLVTLGVLRSVMGLGIARLYEPMAKHTTMRVGGPAQFWLEPETEEGLCELVRVAHAEKIPLLIVGRGSNLIVRDGGLRGAVVRLRRGVFGEFAVEGESIRAGVGVRLKALSGAAISAGLAGFEWMEGIPGDVGGCLRMNAGAMGVEAFDQVERLRYADHEGNILEKTPQELEVSYRHVPLLRTNYALSALFRGTPCPSAEVEQRTRDYAGKRKASQPAGASAGCIFRNPGDAKAGQLVDSAGLKNLSVGAARVSERHANFILNEGGATAAQVLELIEQVRAAVRAKHGFELETEVQIIGEDDTIL
ncbi:MAG: UDP-N-acetylmuramate--L-alanine ligase [Chthoniobacterales bacterium]|nr:UDP-N-acetylmuramate--L-alanine ligase [Chthoniobacterales bacterium]